MGCAGDDAMCTINQVVERAWRDWLWKDEPRVQRNYVERCKGRHPFVEAHRAWSEEASKAEGVANERVDRVFASCGIWSTPCASAYMLRPIGRTGHGSVLTRGGVLFSVVSAARG